MLSAQQEATTDSLRLHLARLVAANDAMVANFVVSLLFCMGMFALTLYLSYRRQEAASRCFALLSPPQIFRYVSAVESLFTRHLTRLLQAVDGHERLMLTRQPSASGSTGGRADAEGETRRLEEPRMGRRLRDSVRVSQKSPSNGFFYASLLNICLLTLFCQQMYVSHGVFVNASTGYTSASLVTSQALQAGLTNTTHDGYVDAYYRLADWRSRATPGYFFRTVRNGEILS